MFRLLIASILLLANNLLSSQQLVSFEKGEVLASFPTIKVSLSNYQGLIDETTLINYAIVTPEFRNVIQYTTSIDESGQFEIILTDKYPYQKVLFNIGTHYKGVAIGHKDVHLFIDLKEASQRKDFYAGKAISFSGEDSDLNAYYSQFLEFKLDKKEDIRKRKLSVLMSRTTQTEFKIRQIRELYREFAKIEQQFTKKHGKSGLWLIENERNSEMYADLAYIFIGRGMPTELWTECLGHEPLMVSELSNRYYGMLAHKLWTHEEKEVKALSKMIFKAKSENEEENELMDAFLHEQDKKKLGLSYDEEVYAKGLEIYLDRYRSQVEDAKLDLYINKLKSIPKEKIGLVGIKGQPLSEEERELYLTKLSVIVDLAWQQELIENERRKIDEWVQWVNMGLQNAKGGAEGKLGVLHKELSSGGFAWSANAPNVTYLLQTIRSYYPERAVLLYLWDMRCESCKEELMLSGRSYDKIADEPLEIVTLALHTDDDVRHWIAELEEDFLPGDHLILSAALSAEIFAYFQIPRLPAYIFIDNEGQFKPNTVFSIRELYPAELLKTSKK